MKICFFCLLGSLGFASMVQAQPRSDTSSQTVSVTFTLINWGQPVTDIAYRQNGIMHKLSSDKARSTAFSYTGPQGMDIYRTPSAPVLGSAPRAAPVVIATAFFDPSIKKASLILLPSGRDKYHVIVIPGDLDKFPPGHAFLINLTSTRLGILCNQTDSVVLKTGEHKLVASNNRGELDAQVAREENGTWQRLESNYVSLRANLQTIVAFVKDPEDSSHIQWIVFRQKLPAEDPIQATGD